MNSLPTQDIHSAEELSLSFKPPKQLASQTARAIYNAWIQATVIDARGTIWIRTDKLHTILRTSTANAKKLLQQAPDRYQRYVGKRTYLLASYVLSLLDKTIQQAGSSKRQQYARFSEEIYLNIRDSDLADKKRLVHWEHMKHARARLKRIRKRKLDIRKDELTGEELSKNAEFSHIRSVSLYYDIADRYWNGLLVNKSTHKRITDDRVCDESDLYKLCRTHGWHTDWYKAFAQQLEKHGFA